MKYIFSVLIFALLLSVQSSAQVGTGKEKAVMAQDNTMVAKIVTPEDAAKTALNVGGLMPAFTLNDAVGRPVSSADLLKKGNLVVVFYRGAWCPFCNKYLHDLQVKLADIKAAGGNLVAISVENPDTSMVISQKNELEFTVLSDPKLNVARRFGIVYELPEDTNKKYIGYGVDLVKANGTEKPELPLSATYVVSGQGEILYAYLEPDYKKRAAPDELIEILLKYKATMIKGENGQLKKY